MNAVSSYLLASRSRAAGGPAAVALAVLFSIYPMGVYAASPDPVATPAEISYAGKWSVDAAGAGDSISLTLRYPPSASNDTGAALPSDLGLARNAFDGPEHPVTFEIRRDAGAFACQGTAGAGRGVGSYRFAPSSQYAQDVVAAGFVTPTLRQQVVAGVFDLRLSFVRAMAAAGLHGVGLDKLVGLKMFGVSPQIVGALHADFPGEGADGLLSMNMVGVTPDYVAALRRARVQGLSADNVSALRAAGVDQAFAERLAAKGPYGLTVDEVARLKQKP